MFIASGEPFRTKVIGVAKGFVDALKDVPTSHEDLRLVLGSHGFDLWSARSGIPVRMRSSMPVDG